MTARTSNIPFDRIETEIWEANKASLLSDGWLMVELGFKTKYVDSRALGLKRLHNTCSLQS